MNPIVEQAINLLKKKLAEKVIEALVARSAFFAGWFVNPIIGFFVPMIIDLLYEQGAFYVEWVWNIIENNIELKNAVKSKTTLKAVLDAKGDYAKAEQAFNEATDDIIHIDT